jgi:hypothetical protein
MMMLHANYLQQLSLQWLHRWRNAAPKPAQALVLFATTNSNSIHVH